MIIYNYRTPVEITGGENVGITGENLIHTQEFVIRGLADGDMTFAIHLRFADGSVNSVVPDVVESKTDGTHIVWYVRKNDIFAHGFFEVQLEGRGSDEAVFQTEIVMLYADESIPVEDRTYENPNSETLKLRDEAYALFEKIDEQEKQIAENAEIIKSSDLSKKADKADTLLGYGITDAYAKTEVDEKVNQKQDKLGFDNAPVIGSQNILTSDRIAAALSYKADSKDVSKKANKSDVDSAMLLKEDLANKIVDKRSITNETVNYPSIKYLTDYFYNSAEADELLVEKYDSSNIEFGSAVLTPDEATAAYISSSILKYQKIGNYVIVHFRLNCSQPSSGNVTLNLSGLPFVNKSFLSNGFWSNGNNTANAKIASESTTLSVYTKISANFDVLATSIMYRIA